MRPQGIGLTAIGAGITAVVTATVVTLIIDRSSTEGDNGYSAANQGIMVAEASDRLPNKTASDWVTYADHVVVVTPIAEKESVTEAEVARGEGTIWRDLTLEVKDFVWSRPNPDKPAPDTFPWRSYGWSFTGGSTENRQTMAGADAPRIEMGHTYIIAIEWQEGSCQPGDEVVPPKWRGLGTDSTVPFDGGVIGVGELEGQVRTAVEARRAADSESPYLSFEDRLAGKSLEDLRQALTEAKPGVREPFGERPASAECK